MNVEKYETDVCIAGAGPAGMVLGLLLAKSRLSILSGETSKSKMIHVQE